MEIMLTFYITICIICPFAIQLGASKSKEKESFMLYNQSKMLGSGHQIQFYVALGERNVKLQSAFQESSQMERVL